MKAAFGRRTLARLPTPFRLMMTQQAQKTIFLKLNCLVSRQRTSSLERMTVPRVARFDSGAQTLLIASCPLLVRSLVSRLEDDDFAFIALAVQPTGG